MSILNTECVDMIRFSYNSSIVKMLASMQETYVYHENTKITVGLIFTMVGQQFQTSLCIKMVSTDLLSCFFNHSLSFT